MPISELLSKRWNSLRFLYRTRISIPRAIHATMRRISRRTTPILLGPWLSEVGFELLYWIPFVRRLFAEYHIAPERVIVISRGGALPWYADLARGYFEILDHLSPVEFAQGNRLREQQAGGKKQQTVSDFDKQLLDLATDRLHLGRFDVVHPWWMYQLFSAFWCGWMDVYRLKSLCEHRAIPRIPPLPEGFPVRADYAAVKFYFSDCFPDTPQNHRFVAALVERLSAQMPVVILNTGFRLDDHADAGRFPSLRVFDAGSWMKPSNNLTIQTAIVAQARALFCTYGGFSYLGPLLGKPTFSFWSEANFVSAHLQFAHEVLNQGHDSPWTVMPTQGAEWWWRFERTVSSKAA